MDPEALIQQIGQIRAQIQDLEAELERVQRTDPDYAAYAERCESLGLAPELALPMVWFHRTGMHQIEAGEPADPDSARVYWRKHRAAYRRHSKALHLN